jgi:acetate kinase
MSEALLAINTGSSSIKFAIYTCAKAEPLLYARGRITGIGGQARFSVSPANDSAPAGCDEALGAVEHPGAVAKLLEWLDTQSRDLSLLGVAHRVVHGGSRFNSATRIDTQVLDTLRQLIPMAPLHQVPGLHAIKAMSAQFPQLAQVACFDTAFHADMPEREARFALPESLWQQGIRRYGFHGLSYAYLASVLPAALGDRAAGRIVLAHLGHGASMCALLNGKSIATSMSFTPLDGLPMGTRSGSLDPAVVLYLLQRGHSAGEVSDILHHQSGLLGLSGISDDMQTLLSSSAKAAQDAVEYFCYRVGRELGSLAAALGGLDGLVFSGGIGEHAAQVRARICEHAAWLGLRMDNAANQAGAQDIAAPDSRVAIRVIPTDEEFIMAQEALAVLRN